MDKNQKDKLKDFRAFFLKGLPPQAVLLRKVRLFFNGRFNGPIYWGMPLNVISTRSFGAWTKIRKIN